MKSLASKVKSLASRPQVLENWPVLGLRTPLFFELLKFCGALEKFLRRPFFFFFFFESTCACVLGLGLEHSHPWPRECLSSERLSLASDFFLRPWPWPRALCSRLHLCCLNYEIVSLLLHICETKLIA